MDDISDNIPLADMLIGLRAELERAQEEGAGKALRFRIEAIDLELQFTATRSLEPGVGFKFWVVNAETKGKIGSESVQKLHLKLNPFAQAPDGTTTSLDVGHNRRVGGGTSSGPDGGS